MKKILKRTVILLAAVIVILFAAFFIYTQDYYKSLSPLDTANAAVDISVEGNKTIFQSKEGAGDTALIFYPGGKVEAIAYAPLLTRLAEQGLTCVLVRMPFNLAVFDMKAADSVYELLPAVKHWYIGGHSLGGAMAGSYGIGHPEAIEGIVFLGAYPVEPTDMPMVTLYGSEDKVVNREKLAAAANQIEIEGGNHAYFGNYGEQKGDGAATITWQEQQSQTAEVILKFVNTEK